MNTEKIDTKIEKLTTRTAKLQARFDKGFVKHMQFFALLHMAGGVVFALVMYLIVPKVEMVSRDFEPVFNIIGHGGFALLLISTLGFGLVSIPGGVIMWLFYPSTLVTYQKRIEALKLKKQNLNHSQFER